MPYELEYKRTVDSTWTVYSTALQAANFPVSISGLVAGTQYDVRCRARDLSGNAGAYSTITQAATASGIVWATVPTITFTQGVAANRDIAQYDNKGATDTITHVAGALPTGVTYNQALKRYEYDGAGAVAGTNGHILLADDATVTAESDWIARSTAAGVTQKTDFRLAADFVTASSSSGGRGKWGSDGGIGQAGYEALVVRDTTDGVTGGACLRLDAPLDGSSAGAAWICSMNPAWTNKSQSFGSTPFYISFRYKIPSSRLTPQPGVGSGGLSDGPKMVIFAGYDPVDPRNGSITHMGPVHVVQNNNWRQYPQVYHYDENNSAFPFGEEYYAPLGSYKIQNAIDRGSQFTDADRYCILSDPRSCFTYFPGEWVTYKYRFKMVTFGSSAGTGNEFDMWAARPGATSWTHLYSQTAFGLLPPDPGWTGVNGVWLTGFETNRVGGSVATFAMYDQLIVSTQDIALPLI